MTLPTTPPTSGCSCTCSGCSSSRHDLLTCPHGEFPQDGPPLKTPAWLAFDGQTLLKTRPNLAGTFPQHRYSHHPVRRPVANPTEEAAIDRYERQDEVREFAGAFVAAMSDPNERAGLWADVLNDGRKRQAIGDRVRILTGVSMSATELDQARVATHERVQKALDERFGKGVTWRPRWLRPYLAP